MSLDPAVRDLLQAIVDLDERTRSGNPSDRSVALASVSGALRAVVRGVAAPANAAVTIRAHLAEFERERAAKASRP